MHAELAHRGDIEHLDGNAELFQLSGTTREFLRKENIRRFIDEIAGQHHPLCYSVTRGVGLLHRGDASDRYRDFDLLRALLTLFALGLVAIEYVGAQANSQRQLGRPFRLDRAAWQVGDDLGVRRCWRKLAHGNPTELHELSRLEVGDFTGTDDDQPCHLESRRRQNIEYRSLLALEPLGRRRARDQITSGS